MGWGLARLSPWRIVGDPRKGMLGSWFEEKLTGLAGANTGELIKVLSPVIVSIAPVIWL